jgi:hypothetical protein
MINIASWAPVGIFFIAVITLYLNLKDRGLIPESSFRAILRYLLAIAVLMGFLFVSTIASAWLATLWHGSIADVFLRAVFFASILSMLLGLIWWNKVAPSLVTPHSTGKLDTDDVDSENDSQRGA